MFGPDTKKVRGKTVTFKKKERKKKRFKHKKKGINVLQGSCQICCKKLKFQSVIPKYPFVKCVTESYILNMGKWELMHKTH